MVNFSLTIEFVQLFSCVWHFVTPWAAAGQASLCFTVAWNLLKLLFVFFWAPKSLWKMSAAMTLKDACSLEEKL